MLRIPAYLRGIEGGGVAPAAEPELVGDSGQTGRSGRATLRVDGRGGFGHYTARRAIEWAMERAEQSQICCVSLVRTGHIGRVGTYAEMAANAGCIGLITVGGGSRDGGGILPFGGAKGPAGHQPDRGRGAHR